MAGNTFVLPDLLSVDLALMGRKPAKLERALRDSTDKVCALQPPTEPTAAEPTSFVLARAQENLQPNAMALKAKRTKRQVKKPEAARSSEAAPAAPAAPSATVATAVAGEQAVLMMPQRKQSRLGEGEQRAVRGWWEPEERQRKVVSPTLQKMCESHARYVARAQKAQTRGTSCLQKWTSAAEIQCLKALDATVIDADAH